VDEGPVGSVDAVLAVYGWWDLDDVDAGGFEGGFDLRVLGDGFLNIDLRIVVVGVDMGVVVKRVGARHEKGLIEHGEYYSTD